MTKIKKDKRINNDLQNKTAQKSNDWVTRTLQSTGGKRRCLEKVHISCSTTLYIFMYFTVH
jgi:hypothetical protein